MKILGIALRTPGNDEILATGVMGVMIVLIATGLIYAEIATVQNAVSLAAGALAGAVANAYGVSLKETGWKGALLTVILSIVLTVLARALMA